MCGGRGLGDSRTSICAVRLCLICKLGRGVEEILSIRLPIEELLAPLRFSSPRTFLRIRYIMLAVRMISARGTGKCTFILINESAWL